MNASGFIHVVFLFKVRAIMLFVNTMGTPSDEKIPAASSLLAGGGGGGSSTFENDTASEK